VHVCAKVREGSRIYETLAGSASKRTPLKELLITLVFLLEYQSLSFLIFVGGDFEIFKNSKIAFPLCFFFFSIIYFVT